MRYPGKVAFWAKAQYRHTAGDVHYKNGDTVTKMLRMLALLALVASTLAGGTRAAHAVPEQVLVYGPSVYGGLSSTEAQKITAMGYTPVVVSNTTWQSLTAAQFASYRGIVIGDTGGNFASMYSQLAVNAGTWGPVLNGNVIVVGTDPEDHGGQQLTRKGIEFALNEPGKTGAYIALSDAFFSTSSPPTFLNGIGSFTVTGASGCWNNVHITATHPALSGLTDASLSNWSCSVHTTFQTWPTGFQALAMARDGANTYTAPDGTTGSVYILARGHGLSTSNISLTPSSATVPVGSSHALTATVLSGGSPVAGVNVSFAVNSGPNAGTSGSGTTNGAGQATFSYSSAVAGTDSATASFLDASSHVQTSNSATVEWQAVVTNTPPTLVLPADQTVQYSDGLSFGVTATDADGDTLVLSASGLPAGLSFIDNGDGTGSVSGNTTAAPGSYVVTFNASDGANPAASQTLTVTVTKEDCTLNYTGDTLVVPLANTRLAGQFGEVDSSHGNWAGKAVEFNLTDSGGGTSSYGSATDATGLAETTQALSANVYGVVVGFAGDSYYNACSSPASPDDTLITVQAEGALVTGGGWFAYSGRTSFGFNLIPPGTGFSGQFQLRARTAKAVFHGNTVTGATKLASNSWRWTGTGRWDGNTGYTFEVTVVDNGTSGKKGDTIAVKVWETANPANVVYDSGTQSLKGGNINVH